MAVNNASPMHQIHQVKNLRATALEPRSRVLLTSTYRSLLAYEVFEHVTQDIAAFLSFQDILSLTQVCQASLNWRSKILSTFVTHLLKRWVSDPLGFRKVLDMSGSVVSGSSVVWFLQRGPEDWAPADLDVYTAYGKSSSVIDWFCKDGYTIIREPPILDATYMVEGSKVLRITKLQKEDKRIDIMETVSMHSMKPILSYHSTVVMNYISANSIGVFYPKLFFDNKGYIRANKEETDENQWEQKYDARSFKLKRIIDIECHPSICATRSRRPLDRHCLTMWLPRVENAMDEDGRQDVEREAKFHLEWNFTVKGYRQDEHKYCLKDECIYEDQPLWRNKPLLPMVVRHAYASVMWHIGRILKEQIGPSPAVVQLMDRNLHKIEGRMKAIMSNPSRLVNEDDLKGYTKEFELVMPLSPLPSKRRRGAGLESSD